MSRWTEEEYAAYERRQHGGPGNARALAVLDVPATRGKGLAGASQGGARRNPSPLELELLGHLQVMQLAPLNRELVQCAGAAECRVAFCAEHRFHTERRWRFDFALVPELVAVELDGGIFAAENGTEAGRHARGAGRLKDYEKRNAAAELGWLVLCYGPPQVRSGEAAIQVERLVRARRLLLAGGAVK